MSEAEAVINQRRANASVDDVENSRHDTSIRLNSAQLNNAYSKCLEIIFLRARDIELSGSVVGMMLRNFYFSKFSRYLLRC